MHAYENKYNCSWKTIVRFPLLVDRKTSYRNQKNYALDLSWKTPWSYWSWKGIGWVCKSELWWKGWLTTKSLCLWPMWESISFWHSQWESSYGTNRLWLVSAFPAGWFKLGDDSSTLWDSTSALWFKSSSVSCTIFGSASAAVWFESSVWLHLFLRKVRSGENPVSRNQTHEIIRYAKSTIRDIVFIAFIEPSLGNVDRKMAWSSIKEFVMPILILPIAIRFFPYLPGRNPHGTQLVKNKPGHKRNTVLIRYVHGACSGASWHIC